MLNRDFKFYDNNFPMRIAGKKTPCLTGKLYYWSGEVCLVSKIKCRVDVGKKSRFIQVELKKTLFIA